MCGVGEPGELLLSGPRLGRGYRGRPDLTADKFIPNPFYATTADLPAGQRRYYEQVYRTGDLVRWAPDGQLEFLGRIDRQVSALRCCCAAGVVVRGTGWNEPATSLSATAAATLASPSPTPAAPHQTPHPTTHRLNR